MDEVTGQRNNSGSSMAIVFTVVIWAVIVPLMNVILPLFFQTWDATSRLAFFGERTSDAQVAAQDWKLYAAGAISIVGTIIIGSIVAVLARRHLRRTNHWIALIVSAALTVVCFIINKVLGMP